MICKPDKGTGIVLLDKDDYVTKMNAVLNDETKFRKMPNEKDRTPTIEKSLSKVLSRIKQNVFIDSTTFERVRPTGTSIPRLYGLPKVHKQGVPLRPILDMTNSPYHGLAKWLVALLSPIRREIATHSLKDTFHFVNSISNVGMHNTKILSLDISSLFTNVPLDETIEYLCEYIEKNDKQIGLPISDLKQLLYFCTKNVQFLFNNQIYRQRDGVAMGSPLGPLLADVFLGKIESTKLNGFIDKCTIYKRYVDDIFCVIEEQVNPDEILNFVNSVHSNLQFTCETENKREISFLDVKITRLSNGCHQREIFRKSTSTNQYIHFDSFVPRHLKQNLIRCLVNHARVICTPDRIQNELSIIKQIFMQNGYPENLVDKTINSVRDIAEPAAVGKKAAYIALPSKGDSVAQLITKRLTKGIEETYKAAKLFIHFY